MRAVGGGWGLRPGMSAVNLYGGKPDHSKSHLEGRVRDVDEVVG